ncbi:MAG: ABC transporter ATP-binding protein [Desulfomonile sp.]|nr:ABC transporter ATP-binding protein [Desulfomonile sp.]
MSNEPIIRAEKLCCDFGHTTALRELNLTVNRGELFGLVGPDGAGKTTVMRILAGILPPTSGNAWVDGVSVKDSPEQIKEHIAYMPQRFGLYSDLTVMENLIFYADLFRVPKSERARRIDRLFEFSRLGPFQQRYAGALSGGMKQKLALACALIHSPRLLLLDEPTNGVDPVSRRDFWRILNDLLREGISILVSTAYLDEAERTHRVGLMNKGTLIRCGDPRALKTSIRGNFLELVTSHMAQAKEILGNLPEVLDLNLFGEGLHIGLDEDADPRTIRRLLEERGIEVLSLRPIRPTVEDVFLSLMRHEESDA